MDIVTRKNVTEIECNTKYFACAFYAEKMHKIENCYFENCSFRKDLDIDYSSQCEFENCNFLSLKLGHGIVDIVISGYVQMFKLNIMYASSLLNVKSIHTLELVGSIFKSAQKNNRWQNNLHHLKNLKELSFHRTSILGRDFRKLLFKICGLESLCFSYENINDTAFSAIENLSSLRKLKFFKSNIQSDWLRYLQSCFSLEEISLGEKITCEGLKYLQFLPNLKKVDLSRTKAGNSGLKYLKDLLKLEWLNLQRSGVTDEGLKYLGNCTHICDLSLANLAGVSDRGVKNIKHLASLQFLSLRGTKVTDNFLRYHLNSMAALRRLDLAETKVSDKGIKYFAENSQLQYLDICGTEIRNILELQKTLATNCEIIYLDEKDWKIKKVQGLKGNNNSQD